MAEHLQRKHGESQSCRESPAIQTQQLQAGAQWWEELLHATGGRLEFDKEGKARLAALPELQQYNNIVLRQSETQNNETITHRDCHNSHKTLGVMEDLSGNNAGERERLQTKASKMAQLISAGSLTRSDASVLYRSVYLGSMGYSLPVTTFTEKELSKIQGAPVQALLSGMGYNRNMPKEVVSDQHDTEISGFDIYISNKGHSRLNILSETCDIKESWETICG